MRDIAILLLIVGGIPFILRNPAVGIGYWVWISLMNPHRYAWGFAYSFPFAFAIAVATLIGLVVTKAPRELKAAQPAGYCFCLLRGCVSRRSSRSSLTELLRCWNES